MPSGKIDTLPSTRISMGRRSFGEVMTHSFNNGLSAYEGDCKVVIIDEGENIYEINT